MSTPGSAPPSNPVTEPPVAPPPPPSRPVVKRRSARTGLWVLVGVVVIVVILVGVGLGTSWYGLQKASTKSTEGACSTGVTLQGNGAQAVNSLLTTWTDTYATASGNQVNYVDGGSGTGITDFSQHPPLTDFAVTDDPLTAAEVGAMPAAPLTLPFVGGALAIIYDLPGFSGHLNLSGAVLEEIYNGTITNWNDAAISTLNPGFTFPSETIVPVVRSDPAGTTYVLTDFLSQESAYWASHVGKGISVSFPKIAAESAVKGNSLVISTVAKTPYAIGYSDLSDVVTYSSPLQYAAVQNPSGNYIVPTVQNTASAIADKVASLGTSLPASADAKDWFNVSMVNAPGTSDYPLSTLIYLFVYQATDKGFTPSLVRSQVLVQWLDYILSPAAQSMANETSPSQLYYTALPSAILAVDQAGIQSMTFNGASIPGCT